MKEKSPPTKRFNAEPTPTKEAQYWNHPPQRKTTQNPLQNQYRAHGKPCRTHCNFNPLHTIDNRGFIAESTSTGGVQWETIQHPLHSPNPPGMKWKFNSESTPTKRFNTKPPPTLARTEIMEVAPPSMVNLHQRTSALGTDQQLLCK